MVFKGKKIKKTLVAAIEAKENETYQLAVQQLKKVIEWSLTSKGKHADQAFLAFVTLGDIYSEAGCQIEADMLYKMATGVQKGARYIFLQKNLAHKEYRKIEDKKEWLKLNKIDETDIIKSEDKKTWYFLFEKNNLEDFLQSMKEQKKVASILQ